MDYNVDKVRNILDKDIEKDLDSMYELKRAESSNLPSFPEKKQDKDSLVLIGLNRYALFEKLKKTWNNSHQRIKDFNQKKIQKFQQIFRLKYMFIYDSSDYTYHKRIRALSKYTFNLNKNLEMDIGFINFGKENIGLSDLFTGFRFYAFKKKLFINTFVSFGDSKDLVLEANYLFKHNLLLDYTYKRNLKHNENVHHIFLNKIFNEEFQGSVGFKYKQNNYDIFLSLNGKKFFGKNYCMNVKTDLGLDQIVMNTKFKQKISDNFFTINNFKLDLNGIFPKFMLKNSVIYRVYNRNIRFGYFYNSDGYGIEFGFNYGGLDIKLPLLVGEGLNFTEYQYYDGLLSISKSIVVFIAMNILTSIILKGINYIFARKSYSKEEVEKRKGIVEESRRYVQKINNNLYSQAEANHLVELNKQNKGLIIHFVLYGKKKSLKKIMNNFLYMKVAELENYIDDIDNEVVDVTIPTRYLIKRDPNLSYSSILFHHIPKTKMIGYVNPIFSSDSKPYLLIK